MSRHTHFLVGSLIAIGVMVMPFVVLAVDPVAGAVGGACRPAAVGPPVVTPCDTGLTCTASVCVAPATPPAGCTCNCSYTTAGGPTTRAIPLPIPGSTLAQATTLCQTTCAAAATSHSGTSPTQTLNCPAGTFTDAESPTPPDDAGSSGSGGSGSVTLFNPLGPGIGVAEFISRGIKMVIGFVGALALLMFIYGGVMWMTAGNSKRVDTSKEILKNSTIGLLLIFFSYSIVTIVFSLLGAT